MDFYAVKKIRHLHRWLDEVSICQWTHPIVCECPTWVRPLHSITQRMSFSPRLREPNSLPFQRTRRRHPRPGFTIHRKPLRNYMIVPNLMCSMSGPTRAYERCRAKKAHQKLTSRSRCPALGHIMFLPPVLMWVKSKARNIALGVIKISQGHLG
jgi:hypothetical protein